MTLPILRYGHPVLRQKGKAIEAITPEVRQWVTDLFDTMYAAHGIGLASQQVGRPVQLAVVDVRGVTDRPSTLFREGEAVEVDAAMPVVLINPEVRPAAAPVIGPEGCLSFPEVYADIERPESVEVRALGLDGREFSFRCGGLLAKAIQHEVDHLNGVLFIDRMTTAVKAELQPELDLLMSETKALLAPPEESEKPAGRRRRKPPSPPG